jgi:hypothetical protein
VSSEAADVGTVVTVIGTTHGGEVVVTEEIALNGVVGVNSVKTDWGLILAVKLASAITGTMTLSETSGGLAITTIAPASTSSGVVTVAAASQGAFNVAPTCISNDATTKQVGIQYTTTAAAVAYQSDALGGATAQTFAAAALLVSEVYIGDVENNRTVTIAVGAEEDELHCVGKALTAASAPAASIQAVIYP